MLIPHSSISCILLLFLSTLSTLSVISICQAHPSYLSEDFKPPRGLCEFSKDKFTGGWYQLATSKKLHETLDDGCICKTAFMTLNRTMSANLDITTSCARWGVFDASHGSLHGDLEREQGTFYLDWIGEANSGDLLGQGPNFIVLKTYHEMQHVLVGGPTPDHWWLLSRMPNWDQRIMNNARLLLLSHGYVVDAYHRDLQVCRFLGGHGKNLMYF